MSQEWVYENYNDLLSFGYKVSDRLFSGQSEFQKVEIYQTLGFGKILLNDDLVMLTEKDEFVYHDMITHVPLFTHPNPKSVLVIGGGDGGTAREVLRHKNVEYCKMVEIDKMVVDACREFIPQTSVALDDSRLDLEIADGIKYVRETDKKYDVVLVDSTDPIGPAAPLFDDEFYKNIYKILNDDGIVVSQGESAFLFSDMQKKLMEIVNRQFPISMIYNFSNIAYPSGLWSFTFGSKKYHPLKNFNPQRVEDSSMEFQY
ncbi:MAG: polyamine aminopropyltransferase, partial [Bdellovibrionales bacterium]|nr:polyamine aminopropyltransferase [Bdellovibrionales bacterium]